MKKEIELVSIIMSVYNENENELFSSIKSILDQTYTNIEIIVINDNPLNNSINKVISNAKDERIKLIENKKNIGLVSSLNKAIKYSKGKYIARMDADDISNIDRIEKQLSFLKENNLDIVGSNIEYIYEDKQIEKRLPYVFNSFVISRVLNFSQCVPHPTWLLKKDVYIKLNGYREIFSCEDYDFLLRAKLNGYRIANIKEELLKYRIRRNSISHSNSKIQDIIKHYLSIKRNDINSVSMDDIYNLLNKEEKIYEKYCELLIAIRTKSILLKITALFKLIINKYFIIKAYNRFRYVFYLLIDKIALYSK